MRLQLPQGVYLRRLTPSLLVYATIPTLPFICFGGEKLVFDGAIPNFLTFVAAMSAASVLFALMRLSLELLTIDVSANHGQLKIEGGSNRVRYRHYDVVHASELPSGLFMVQFQAWSGRSFTFVAPSHIVDNINEM